MTRRIAVVGTGLIGQERLSALRSLHERGEPISISGICDPNSTLAARLAQQYSTTLYSTIDDVIQSQPDWIFIAAPHDVAADLTLQCVRRGIRTFVEKPLGRSYEEAQKIAACVTTPNSLYVGYNYRFFDGISALIGDVKSGLFGEIVSVNLVLGHGHNPDMTGSWKLDPMRAGGGCLIDPGVHMLDLCQIFSDGKLQVVGATLWNGFWKTGVEEECHVLLKADAGFALNLQTSIVRWRSTFSIEVNGTEGYGRVTGRGRSFGPQQYIRGKRWGWMAGKPQAESEVLVCQTDGANAFLKETQALLFPQDGAALRVCDIKESLKTMELLDRCRLLVGIPSTAF